LEEGRLAVILAVKAAHHAFAPLVADAEPPGFPDLRRRRGDRWAWVLVLRRGQPGASRRSGRPVGRWRRRHGRAGWSLRDEVRGGSLRIGRDLEGGRALPGGLAARPDDRRQDGQAQDSPGCPDRSAPAATERLGAGTIATSNDHGFHHQWTLYGLI